jgi:Smr domain
MTMSNLQIGDTVSVRRTGERGTILGRIDEDTWEVLLFDAAMEIPMAADDLFRERFVQAVPNKEDEQGVRPTRPRLGLPMQTATPAAIEQKIEPKAPPPLPIPKLGKSGISNEGLVLGLVPSFFGPMGELLLLQPVFINDSPVTVQVLIVWGDQTIEQTIPAGFYQNLPEIGRSNFENHFEWTWAYNMPPLAKPIKPTAKVRFNPKHLDKASRELPCGLGYGIAFVLADKPERSDTDSLEALKAHARSHKPEAAPAYVPAPTVIIPDSNRFAHFDREIDLHIEKLHSDPGKLTEVDMLNLQLDSFYKYFNEALSLGIEDVTVIHGKGKGTLRTQILMFLRNHHDVIRTENSYKGMLNDGATKIYFKR